MFRIQSGLLDWEYDDWVNMEDEGQDYEPIARQQREYL